MRDKLYLKNETAFRFWVDWSIMSIVVMGLGIGAWYLFYKLAGF